MLSTLLEMSGYKVTPCYSVQEATELINKERFDLYILDYQFQDGTGVEICQHIRSIDQNVPVIFYSGQSTEWFRSTAAACGATEYLVKPSDLDNLEGIIARYLPPS